MSEHLKRSLNKRISVKMGCQAQKSEIQKRVRFGTLFTFIERLSNKAFSEKVYTRGWVTIYGFCFNPLGHGLSPRTHQNAFHFPFKYADFSWGIVNLSNILMKALHKKKKFLLHIVDVDQQSFKSIHFFLAILSYDHSGQLYGDFFQKNAIKSSSKTNPKWSFL